MTLSFCTVTTLKTTPQQTLEFVHYHLNLSVDHMFLFFDDPDDPSVETLASYEQVTCIRCNEQHWARLGRRSPISAERQYTNADLAWTWAQEKPYARFMHLDSDELLYVDGRLQDLWAEASTDKPVIQLLPLEAVPEQDYYPSILKDVSLFKVQLDLSQIQQAAKAGFQAQSYADYFRGHLIGKSIINTAAKIAHVRSHAPRDASNQKLPTHTAAIGHVLHFDCCSFEVWLEKGLNQYHNGFNPRLRPGRRQLFEAFCTVFKQQDQEQLRQLYKQQFFLTEPDRAILEPLGLLRRIHLPSEQFDPPQL